MFEEVTFEIVEHDLRPFGQLDIRPDTKSDGVGLPGSARIPPLLPIGECEPNNSWHLKHA